MLVNLFDMSTVFDIWHIFYLRQNVKCSQKKFSIYFCSDCFLFVSQEYNTPRWERSISKWNANKVTQNHKRLKMKREGDKGKRGRGVLWDPDSHPAWYESASDSIARVSRALPLGVGLRWITLKVITIHEYEMPFKERNAICLLPYSMFVYRHLSIILLPIHTNSHCLFQPQLPISQTY